MIRPLERKDIITVSKIHTQELPGFLSEMGATFLENFYLASLGVSTMFTLVYLYDNRVVGLATGITHSKGLFKVILEKRFIQFIYIILIHIITHPSSLRKIFTVITYPGISTDHAELLTIAVDRRFRDRGVGKRLTVEIVREFKKMRIKRFLVSVYDRLPSNEFYKKMGFQYKRSFDFLGEKMNYYEYTVLTKNSL